MQVASPLLFVAAAVVLTAQAPPALQPPLKTTTTAVVIDLVAHDNHGQPVLDLTRDDFELKEDGVRQRIQLCTLIQAGAKATGQPAEAAPGVAPELARALPPPDAPAVTALLFDRLSPEVRPLAHRAALAYLDTLGQGRDYAGVFLADLDLHTFQPFTTDREALRTALDKVAMAAPSNLDPKALRAANGRVDLLDPSVSPTADAETAGSGAADPLQRQHVLEQMDPTDRMLAEMEWRLEQGYQRMLSESQGEATVAGLRDVIHAFGLAPGRKSIMYFSEGVTVTSRVKSLFDEVIEEANAANVTVYAIDAAGLRVHSEEAAAKRSIDVAGSQGVGDIDRDANQPFTRELERQEQVLSSRPAAAMGRLANETGGFLLDNTNNLAAGVARMEQERSSYYLLLYESTNPKHDGTYRDVDVKLKRRGIRIRARSGYIAR